MTRSVRWMLVGVLALVAMTLTAFASRSGLGISPDSVTYVAAATSLADGMGFLSYTGEPLTLFPPGLPALLAVPIAIGLSATAAALVMNLICAAALVVGAYLLGVRTLASPVQALGVAAVVAVMPAVPETLSMLWTEPAFSVLVLALLVALASAVGARQGFGWTWMLLSTVLVGAAASMRYVGVVLVVVVFVGAWLAAEDRRRGVPVALLAAALASLGPILLVLRNLAMGAGALGERYPGTQTIPQAVERAVRLWGDYLTQVPEGIGGLVGGLAVVALLVIGAVVALRQRGSMLVVATFLTVYWVVIWWSQGTTRIDVVSDRLGFPALVPVVLLAWFGVSRILLFVARRWPGGARTLGAGAFVIVVVGALIASLQSAHALGSTGRGYAAPARASSEIGAAIAALPTSEGVASDDPWGVWWWRQSGRALHIPPSLRQWPPERVDSDLTLLRSRVSDGSVTYVAYVDGSEPALTPEELTSTGFELTDEVAFADGRLFRIAEGSASS